MSVALPKNWRRTTLGEIAREKPNNGIFKKNPEYLTNCSGGLPVVWLEELFRGNSIETANSRRVNATKAEVEKYGLKNGDVLFCRSSLKLDGIAFNNVYLGEDNAALFECHLIRVSPRLEDVWPAFLNWLLRSPQVRAIAKSKSKTATMTTIDQQSLASISFHLPPLSEQRRIAEVLDRADALRAKRRAALAQLDSLTQSLFLELFGDPVANDCRWPLQTVGDFVAGFESGKSLVADDEDDTTSPYRVLKVSAVTSLDYRPGQSKALPPNYEPPASHIVRNGDLLFSRANTSELIGATAYVFSTPPNLLLPDKLWRFLWHQEPRADPHFVRYLFRQTKFRQEIARRASGTSGSMKNISQGKVLTIHTGLPPLPLQREFARRVSAVEKLKTAQRASLAELDALFASLQHRAFRGEL